MIAVPLAAPVTMPEPAPIVATAVFPLCQVPLAVASLMLVLVPLHIFVSPLMADGDGFTVTVLITMQPKGAV